MHESVPFAVRRAYRAAQLLYTPQEVAYALDQMAVRLTVDWQQANPVCAVVLPRGLVFAGMLLRRMVFPLQLITLLEDASPELDSLADRQVLLLDAQADAALHDRLAEQLLSAGAAGVERVVLLAAADESDGYRYVGVNDGCRRLLGCGFTLDGYGGNLPGIYTYPEKI